MIREAQYDGQCAECCGKISVGDRQEYLPPSGKFPAVTSHYPNCPEPKKVEPRGVNHAQRGDPELRFIFRTCGGCEREWGIARTDLASRRETFVCTYCSEQAAQLRAVA